MKKARRLFLTALIAYFLSWTVIYAVVMQGDFGYYGRYLQLAWTSPGEIPAMIQLGALISTVTTVLIAWFYLRKKRND